ncbi:MAG: hypothetical protein IBX47_09590 [Desulfuromonadales bacterium]|nr:hypothetical protein [Desulfuromonadales bacterium]
MKVKALITGVENIKGAGHGPDPRSFDFWKVNFVDTEDPAGSLLGMTLPKDFSLSSPLISYFESVKLKIVEIQISVNGKYINYLSHVKP